MEKHHTCNRQIILTKWAMASITLLEYGEGKTIVLDNCNSNNWSWLLSLVITCNNSNSAGCPSITQKSAEGQAAEIILDAGSPTSRIPQELGDLMGFYGGLMGSNGILWWFNGI